MAGGGGGRGQYKIATYDRRLNKRSETHRPGAEVAQVGRKWQGNTSSWI